MQDLTFEQLIQTCNPSDTSCFEILLSAACKYFPLTEKSLTAHYNFSGGGFSNLGKLETEAHKNRWKVKMIYPEQNDFHNQKIEFTKLNPNEYWIYE